MLCFLPPMPAHRPEPPGPAPLPERAAEAVLLIVIVLNVFFVIAALVPPLLAPAGRKAATLDPAHPHPACATPARLDAPAGGCR